MAALPWAALTNAFDVATTSRSSSVLPMVVVESPSWTWMTMSDLPSPEYSEPPPNTLCHTREPWKTAPITITTKTQSVTARTARRLRRRRASRIRSARLSRRRGGPTATGCGRSRSHASGIADLVEHGPPLIQPALQYSDGRGLVDHRLLSPCPNAGFAQRALRRHSGQPLVSHPHRGRRDASSQILGELDGVLRGRTGSLGERTRQSDHHLNGLQFADELGEPSQVAIGLVAADGFHRRGEDAIGVADRDTDANTSHIHAHPTTPTGIVASGPIRQPVLWVGHLASSGLSPREARPVPRRCLRPPYRNPAPCRPCRRRGRSLPHPAP